MTRSISRLRPRGLRWRLTAWVAGVMVVSAAAVFAVVYQDTGAQLRGTIDHDVSGDASQFAQALRSLPDVRPRALAGAAARYIDAQPYTATSTLLFALPAGAPPVSNHPEAFGGSAPEDRESAATQAQEDAMGRKLRVGRIGYSIRTIPDVGQVRLFEQSVRVGGATAVVGAGEPLTLVARAQHGVAKAFLLAGGAALLLALISSYLAGARVSAPLRRMAAVAARVDAGDLAPRMDTRAGRGSEIHVLAEAFNHMLDRLGEAFTGQRKFVADASHELRTPLTVIRGQLEVLAAQEDPPVQEIRRVERLVGAEVSRISRLVDDLLLLARAERTDFLHPEPIDVHSFVSELWDGASHTADRRFELGPLPTGTLTADPDRLAQAVRNLVRNAIDHTEPGRGVVRLEVQRAAVEKLRFRVLDDGPGIPAGERDRVFERFYRVDDSRSRAVGGTGLGLAIVRAIAEAHGGYAQAAASNGNGGARVEFVLPGFRAQ